MQEERLLTLHRVYGGIEVLKADFFKNEQINSIVDLILLARDLTADELTIFLNLRPDACEVFMQTLFEKRAKAYEILDILAASEIPKVFYTYEFIAKLVEAIDDEVELIRCLTMILPDFSASTFFDRIFDQLLGYFYGANQITIVRLNFILFTQLRNALNENYMLSQAQADQVEQLQLMINEQWTCYLGAETCGIEETALELYVWSVTKLVREGFFIDLTILLASYAYETHCVQYLEAILSCFAERAEFVFREPILSYLKQIGHFYEQLQEYLLNGGTEDVFEEVELEDYILRLNMGQREFIQRKYQETYGHELVLEYELF